MAGAEAEVGTVVIVPVLVMGMPRVEEEEVLDPQQFLEVLEVLMVITEEATQVVEFLQAQLLVEVVAVPARLGVMA